MIANTFLGVLDTAHPRESSGLIAQAVLSPSEEGDSPACIHPLGGQGKEYR